MGKDEAGNGNVRLARTVSVRQGRPRIMAPLPSMRASLAFSSFYDWSQYDEVVIEAMVEVLTVN